MNISTNPFRLLFRALSFSSALFLVLATNTYAGSATWNLNPTSNDWNTAANWTPATVPNSSIDTATFAVSNVTGITLTASTTVASLIFNPGASAYTFNAPIFPADLNITGVGIVNNSGVVQTFNSTAQQSTIVFRNTATAGDLTAFIGPFSFAESSTAGTANFTLVQGPVSVFSATSNAGHATLLVPGSATFAPTLTFSGNSSAASANITAEGTSVTNGIGGIVNVQDDATAGSATITAKGATAVSPNGHSVIAIGGRSNAGNAVLIATGGTNGGDGGRIVFSDTSDGSGARAEMFGNGELDTSLNHAVGVSLGSIEGDGLIFLGGRPLTVTGALSTTFSGVIQDGGIAGGTGGSLVQAGTGTLTLSGVNTYTGSTTVNGGVLALKKPTGAGSRNLIGPVSVPFGTLAGNGRVGGIVSIGDNGGGTGSVLAPGLAGLGVLTIDHKLTFFGDATYDCELNSNTLKSDRVAANRVAIASSHFSLTDLGASTLPAGTAFTVINNTSSKAIAGVFANLFDGGTITAGSNNFRANYKGGDGNDLTLTVQ